MFDLHLTNPFWLYQEDPTKDLCAHGTVEVTIGDARTTQEATVSAAALELLRSLQDGHDPVVAELQLLPCCGFSMYPTADDQDVLIIGCPEGVDWGVTLAGERVLLTPADGPAVTLPWTTYARAVCNFADEVAAFYAASAEKRPAPDDEAAYAIFWRQWHRLRAAASVRLD
ncbi:hypothetical protein [Lacticaseibacillus kribbianus]|uniref:hypothetical protein n=1 Tax=Lacticaseibacillus kribbianus TaxID=2926292 RepID=UPI001CD39C84|nr:hypothetical protein [Lacticaseibacillus kribbianus]